MLSIKKLNILSDFVKSFSMVSFEYSFFFKNSKFFSKATIKGDFTFSLICSLVFELIKYFSPFSFIKIK